MNTSVTGVLALVREVRMTMVEPKTSTTESSPKAIRASDRAWMPRAIDMNTSKMFHPLVAHVGHPILPVARSGLPHPAENL